MGIDEFIDSVSFLLSLWSLGCFFKQHFARRKPTRIPNMRTRVKEIAKAAEIRIAVFGDPFPAKRILGSR